MTEVEQARDVFMQPSDHHHQHVTSSTHRTTSSSSRERQRYNRHSVHNPQTLHSAHQSPQKRGGTSSANPTKRVLPPGWEVVSSEGGLYYWHKSTGKTTWKYPTEEAREHKRKQQSHTYINIRPGHRPHVLTSKNVESLTLANGNSEQQRALNGIAKMSHKTGSNSGEVDSCSGGRNASVREGEFAGVGEREEVPRGGGSVGKPESLGAVGGSQETLKNSEKTKTPGSPGVEAEGSGDYDKLLPSSPSAEQRRPLVVHNYENFPFNPTTGSSNMRKTKQHDSVDGVPQPRAGAAEDVTSPRTRTGSNVSSTSSAPSLPERCYSESEISASPVLSPSPTQNDAHRTSHVMNSEQRVKNSSPGLPIGQSRSNEIQREVSEQGNEYAVVNPAWKKNVKGRAPSLTRVNDEVTSIEWEGNETPPPLPNRPAELLRSRHNTNTGGHINLDSDLVKQKRAGLNISDRFSQSVKYSDVVIGDGGSQVPPESPGASQGHTSRDGGAYDVIGGQEPLIDENAYEIIGEPAVKKGDHSEWQSSSLPRKNERWLKTQSAYVTSVTSSPPALSPSPHPHSTTPTTPPCNNLTPGDGEEEEEEERIPAVPLKMGSRLGSEFTDDRRLHAMNVTIRRPSVEREPSMNGLTLSKEALLLRSGVTLRPGVHPPRSPVSMAMGGDGGEGSGPSGSDEEDGLEPVSRAIKSLESRITTRPPGQQQSPGPQGDQQLKADLMMLPDGPPNWMQFQRRSHKYEDIEILDDSMLEGVLHDRIPRDPYHGGARSVDNLHNMAWDESDIRSQPEKSDSDLPLVSASQPCLIDTDAAFPHLMKPSRVSKEAYNLRKNRLLRHKYEDIDIPEWVEVGGAPGSDTSVGDMPSPAVRDSWLEADKDSAATDSGTMLPKGWQRMTDEQNKPYYWHIPTGQTQYTKPTGEVLERLSLSLEDSGHPPSDQSDHSATPPATEVEGHTFPVCYLGNHPVEESELVPGECVKVVHSSIHKTNSLGNIKSKPLYLVIRGMELQWVEPEATSPTAIQPINRIRVWGIGLEDERTFGYVARDQTTRKHKCHVFRCDMPARAVAKALLENHQKMTNKPTSVPPMTTVTAGGRENSQTPPTQRRIGSPDLSSSRRRTETVSGSLGAVSPPSRAAENVETTSCVYIGSCEVAQSQGIDILNSAVDQLCSNKSRWINVNISIATSNIKIITTKSDRVIGEHRVRFLCFLGIARDDRFCGYILESARGKKPTEKKFLFHGFKMEPNTDKLCLTLHTACQARYQHVLDAHPEAVAQQRIRDREAERLRSKSTSSILGRLGSFKKPKREEADSRVFTVQYLGCQQVPKSEGLEVVKGPIQQLSIPKSSVGTTPTNLVEFEVSLSGLSMTDPQKRLFSKKNFNVKYITYVVRIRNYFAFVVRDGSKYQCHVFLETEVSAATIVTTIQRMLAPETSKKR